MITMLTSAKKTSLTQRAFWIALFNGTLLLINLINLLLNQSTITSENYATLIPLRHTIRISCIILLIVVLILSVKQTMHSDKEDELAKLHRYKAGYISLYIFLFAVIFLIYTVKNFESAFISDPYGNANVGFMLYSFSQCIENIVFIYLEKRSLE